MTLENGETVQNVVEIRTMTEEEAVFAINLLEIED